jgi:phage terminase large subunit GpA-like protein
MITTRWIVHCETCGYLLRPEYPAQWMPDKDASYQFHHKREALRGQRPTQLAGRPRLGALCGAIPNIREESAC